jgi:hypothetical protein
MRTVQPTPEVRVCVHEIRELKHDGGHSVEVSFLGRSFQSAFIHGNGAWKPINYVCDFPLTFSEAAAEGTWAWGSVHFRIRHERLLTDSKVVGECFVPAAKAKNGAICDWFPIIYKGMHRGSIKVTVQGLNVLPSPASTTVRLDAAERQRLLRSREPSSSRNASREKPSVLPAVTDNWPL